MNEPRYIDANRIPYLLDVDEESPMEGALIVTKGQVDRVPTADVAPIVHEMCNFCRTDELGDSMSKPLTKDHKKIFKEKLEIETRIFGNAMEIYIGFTDAVLYSKRRKFKFCPMCGRVLKESEGEERE